MVSSEQRISELVSRSRTVCLGRFLIDVPIDTTLTYGPAFADANLDFVEGAARNLPELLRMDQEDSQNEATVMRVNDPMIGKVIDGIVTGQKLLFAYMGSSIYYQIKSYTPIGEDLIVSWRETEMDAASYNARIHSLNEMAKDVRIIRKGEIPREAGFCLGNALIPLPKVFQPEHTTLGIRMKNFDDVHISIEMTAKDRIVESDALEPRIRMAEESAKSRGHAAWFATVKTLRRGQHFLGSWDGYEFLARKPQQEVEGESHEFNFVSHGRPNDPKLPVLSVTLQSGLRGNEPGAVAPSLTDSEAIMLWDRLTKSIRLRPVIDVGH